MPNKNCSWRTICCKQSDRCICKERWEEWEKLNQQKIKRHNLYCICNIKSSLYLCPVHAHKLYNRDTSLKIAYLVKTELFPLDVKEEIIKKINSNIYFEEHFKQQQIRKEQEELERFRGNEYY